MLFVHVDDIKGCARKGVAESLLVHLNKFVGQCKADYTSFLHTGIQHEHSSGAVYAHQYVYIDSMLAIDCNLFIGQAEEAECGVEFHEVYRSVLGAVAWIALTRADLAVYIQALQRWAHAPRIQDCKRLDIAIRYLKGHKCCLRSVQVKHPLKLVAVIDAAFKAELHKSARANCCVVGVDELGCVRAWLLWMCVRVIALTVIVDVCEVITFSVIVDVCVRVITFAVVVDVCV